ncbi:FtsQ-type POTRA domain-containing protein [Paenibacillus oenotherae]|uniref:Cell division protein DivIB n=1 Tax=Paenibacillus oenotherae TaxID=1435645 RepID=A0ABS7D127_9BACL|nr:FtsQ-type POTRA domain-containing protein [Paenibacillus oenotherae]MBW7473645.1 FtsQ-type POTRA domain-containing protein [Paenibacillus oenotherae]
MQEKVPVLREPVRKKRRGGRKLLIVIIVLFIVILCVLFFNSSISKVSTVTVEGQRYLTVSEVQGAAGIVPGDAYFGTSAATIEERVKSLKPIEKVEVIKSFPGSIRIVVQEYPTVAYELSDKGELTAILASGISVAAGSSDLVVDKPILSGWKADDPLKTELSKQLSNIPAALLSDFSEIIPFPSKAFPDRIRIYTRTRFEIITAASLLPDKISTLNAVIETQEPGLLTLLIADTYESFVPDETENDETKQKEATQ